ncbi:MAG: DUF3644 domain-containing protein [Oscillospiraceae bacterium]|nr:DUF3644 domain-containing protein [Oscillospiraceae bacterium]
MDNNALVSSLLGKSKEAFMMAIEIYNKPSIKYRVEGFSFFICNAWELMLKARIIKTQGIDAIYYKDNPSRTKTLENCIKLVFTNEYSPIHKNLMRIVDLRNTSTHFIVEEYEMVYIPLFQACVLNYTEKMQEFHNIDIMELIPQNFLTLSVSMKALNESEIRAKYPGQIAERLISAENTISSEIAENNSAFAIRIEHYHYITKDRSKATDIVHIDSAADPGIQIIKELKDPNETHKYSAKKCIQEINNRLTRKKITLMYNGEAVAFTSYHFNLFCKYYKIKENPKLCYVYTVTSSPSYGYSLQAIDFIVAEIAKDPVNIVDNIKKWIKKES